MLKTRIELCGFFQCFSHSDMLGRIWLWTQLCLNPYALLYFIIYANLDHIFVHSLPNLKKLVLEEKMKAFYFSQSSEGCSFAVWDCSLVASHISAFLGLYCVFRGLVNWLCLTLVEMSKLGRQYEHDQSFVEYHLLQNSHASACSLRYMVSHRFHIQRQTS